jgi:hypothetical protein
MATANEIIDFELERGRHGMLLGREDAYSDHAALPGILEELQRAGSR